jgi:hypothetical protein
MSIKTIIASGRGDGLRATVVKPYDYLPPGQLVYTREQKTPSEEFQNKGFINATNGINMAIDASVGGTPVLIHNGTDTAEWTGAALSGTWDFASTTVAQAGTKSIDATSTVNNDQAQFEGGATVDMSGYTAISGYIYITGWSTSGTKDVRLLMRLAGVDVGVELDLSNYIDTNVFNTWQKFTITKSDLSISTETVDQLIATTIDIGAGPPPNYYLDTIQIEETGGGVDYEVRPDAGSSYTLADMSVWMVDALAGTANNNLAYDQLLGVASLPGGIQLVAVQNGNTVFSSTFRQLGDFLRIPPISSMTTGTDGTNTWVKMNIDILSGGIVLRPDTLDYVRVTISDDLSGLLQFSFLSRGIKETII